MLEGTSFGNYLHTMHFFDAALETFKASLAERGLLDSSVVVVFGDHDAGFVRDAALSRIIGIRADEVAWTLNDRVPVFIRIPGAGPEQKLQGRRTMSAGQTDLAPTLLTLFGIDASGLAYVGRDLLGRPDGPVLRPYGEWLNSHYLFTTRAAAAVCRDLTSNHDVANACGDIDRDARRARAISRLVVETDLQERLRQAASVSAR